MTEEAGVGEAAPTEKLSIDNPSDFLFHAAYLAYSTTFDRTANPEAKKSLNESIAALQKNEIDYATFYRNIDRYRVEDTRHEYGRSVIRTQRKKEWRRKTQKHERIQRHKR